MSTLSVVINTKNAEATLERALKSVEFADQVVVADMHSSDRTVQIAQQFGAVVIQVPDADYVEPARNKALEQATSDWVCILDADEEISAGLADWMKQLINESANSAECYKIPRLNIIFDHPMTATGWWPDYQVRLFKRGYVTWKNEIHAQPKINGTVADLPADTDIAIIHHNYQTISQFISRLDRYTRITAEQNGPLVESKQLSLLTLFFRQFLSRYFAEQGYKDGAHGQALSLLQACYELVTTLKQWQMGSFANKSMSTTAQLRVISQELNYWIADYMCARTNGIEKIWWMLRRKLKI